MKKSTRAALATLARYARTCGKGERDEPQDWQASDLITDLLLAFDPDTAAKILRRVERDYAEERDTTAAVIAAV